MIDSADWQEKQCATCDRPWGTYVVLDEGARHKVKRITIRPTERLSYQRHQRRAEHWFITQGHGIVTIDDERLAIEVGAAVDVPIGAAHRLENTGRVDLVFIEVQYGDYFGEDDIVRLADDYGRCPAPPGDATS